MTFVASANKNGNAAEVRQAQEERNLNGNEQRVTARINSVDFCDNAPETRNEPVNPNAYPVLLASLKHITLCLIVINFAGTMMYSILA